VDFKICSMCKIEKPLDRYYSQNKVSKSKDEYTYYNPECKECTSEKAKMWGLKNKERKYKNNQSYIRTKKGIEASKRRHEKYNESGKRDEWISKNKDKFREYALRHRHHQISETEWNHCKEYFNFRCAYCGKSEKEHRTMYNQQLHREHVDPNGANDISNCVPSCKNCNSQKSEYNLEDWYTSDNQRYCEVRLEKINRWIETDHLKYLN
jgi:hypothetical protein